MCATRLFRISAANIGPNRFHQNRTVSWLMSIPRSAKRSSTLRSDSGYFTYISTARPCFIIDAKPERQTLLGRGHGVRAVAGASGRLSAENLAAEGPAVSAVMGSSHHIAKAGKAILHPFAQRGETRRVDRMIAAHPIAMTAAAYKAKPHFRLAAWPSRPSPTSGASA